MMRATLPRMETDEGTYRQELDAWRKAATSAARPMPCPWPTCPTIALGGAMLHAHLDIVHDGTTP